MRWERQNVWRVALVFGLLLSVCGREEEPEYPQPYLAALPGPGGPVGTVLETMNSGVYTYARIGAENAEIWRRTCGSFLSISALCTPPRPQRLCGGFSCLSGRERCIWLKSYPFF